MSAGVAYVGPSGQTAFVLCAGELDLASSSSKLMKLT